MSRNPVDRKRAAHAVRGVAADAHGIALALIRIADCETFTPFPRTQRTHSVNRCCRFYSLPDEDIHCIKSSINFDVNPFLQIEFLVSNIATFIHVLLVHELPGEITLDSNVYFIRLCESGQVTFP